MKFKDKFGTEWALELTFETADRIKTFVQANDGKPLDIFEIVEKGDFTSLKNMRVLAETAFHMALEQILKEFDSAEYDTANADLLAAFPERKSETKIQKAGRWFQSRIDGAAMESLADAVPQAILNFTLSRDRKEALNQILAAEKDLESELMKQGVEKYLEKTSAIKENLESLIEKTFLNQESHES